MGSLPKILKLVQSVYRTCFCQCSTYRLRCVMQAQQLLRVSPPPGVRTHALHFADTLCTDTPQIQSRTFSPGWWAQLTSARDKKVASNTFRFADVLRIVNEGRSRQEAFMEKDGLIMPVYTATGTEYVCAWACVARCAQISHSLACLGSRSWPPQCQRDRASSPGTRSTRDFYQKSARPGKQRQQERCHPAGPAS